MLYKLHYFNKSDGICANDFNNTIKFELINLSFILSISELLDFRTPLSGRFVDKYGVLTMSNNDKYFINEKSFTELNNAINLG